MPSDIEIANAAKLHDITKIAARLGLKRKDLIPYTNVAAKIARPALAQTQQSKKGKLILVTALTPTPAGEGKSTVSIALADALCKIRKKAVLSLREPSLGPCFGIKGGATGGGFSQIVPMDFINLNFTGDLHAITTANNLLASLIDNHIKFGNALKIKKIFFKRCIDLNDRALRQIKTGLGGRVNGTPQNTGFAITAASEIMAVFCLAQDLADLKQRINKIVIAEDENGNPVLAESLNAAGAMAAILKEALLPNLVQTLSGTPAFVHGGPFANIAHGTSSLIAARTALKTADFVVTEAGFGADLGAEKFFDIVARTSGLFPDAVVLVATIRALKMHGLLPLSELKTENIPALKKGFANLKAHIANLRKFGYNPVVAINRFSDDTKKELNTLLTLCKKEGVTAVISEGWAKGAKGGVNLAKAVIATLNETKASPTLLYPDTMPLKDKIKTIATKIYGAKNVSFSPAALKKLKKFTAWGYGSLPVCIAKTQNSLSHDKTLLGAPEGYTFPVTDIALSAGAGFIVALSGTIYTMPGLPKVPAATAIDVSDDGLITGLF